VVVDKLYELRRKIELIPEYFENNTEEKLTDLLHFQIRAGMLSILKKDLFPLKERLLLIFHMLLSLQEECDFTTESIEKHQAEAYSISLAEAMRTIPIPLESARLERKELFLDIIWNYKEETQYQDYLKELSILAEEIDTEKEEISELKQFRIDFSRYSQLLENSIALKIFSNCLNEDIEETLLSYQMIVLEYIMLEYSAYLKWQQGRMEDQQIRTGIVIYTRMIEYNSEGIKEYFAESYDKFIWDFSYLLLLLEAI
jgi:lysine-N-methylase